MKLTEGGGAVWSPAGDRIYFASLKGTALEWKRSDGSGDEETLVKDEHHAMPTSVSADGRTLLYTKSDPETGLDVFAVATTGGAPRPLVQTRAQEGGARFAPDGRHVAYVSDESGRFEIYVMEYPGPGGKWQISRNGGKDPIWSGDGRKLYFRSIDTLMTSLIETTPSFRSGSPEVVVDLAYEGLLGTIDRPNYDIAADGRILAVTSPEAETGPMHVRLILNFFQDLAPKN